MASKKGRIEQYRRMLPAFIVDNLSDEDIEKSLMQYDQEAYDELLVRDISSSPNQFISLYSSERPSKLTKVNFRIITDHEAILRGMRNLAGKRDYRDNFSAKGEELYHAAEQLVKSRPNLKNFLGEETRRFLFIHSLFHGVSSHYLNSLDIPLNVKASYPTAERERTGILDSIRGGLLGVIRGGEEEFWHYLRKNPDKDLPVDFNNDGFAPEPSVPNYQPRKLFKQAVGKLYKGMAELIEAYRGSEMPFVDSDILSARVYLLGKIKESDELISPKDSV